jgi:hypothetical protein
MDERQRAHDIVESVVDGVTNERFLQFIDTFTGKYIDPRSPDYLCWQSASGANTSEDDDYDEDSHCRTTNRRSTTRSFSLNHYNVFCAYAAMFDARLRSIVRTHSDAEAAPLTPERFIGMCRTVLQSPCPPAHSTEPRDPWTRASLEELVGALLEIVDYASDFNRFYGMMRRRQEALLVCDGSSDEDTEGTTHT